MVAGNIAFSLAPTLGAAGCGSGPPSGAISGGTLSGKIQAKPWTFVSGVAACDATSCRVSAFAVDGASCASTPEADEFRISNFPNQVGSYALDATVTASFDGGDSITVNAGEVAVYDITATTLTGGANVAVPPTSMTGTYVNGKFQVPICL
jgi:hypothetical protein